MATRVYDIYDLNSAFVQPTAPAPAPPPTARRDATRLLRGFAYLLTYAGALLLAALLAAFTPLGRIDADVTVPFVLATLGTLAAIVWSMVRK